MLANIGVLLVIALVAFVFLCVWLSGNMKKNRETVAAAEAALPDRFGTGDYHVVLPGPRCIGIAWDAETLVMGDTVEAATAIPFAIIRSADIEVDGAEVTTSRSTTRTNRGSQAIGGAIGGLALGPAGLLIGGLSGSSTTTGKAVAERKIKTIKLVVRVADRIAPLRTFSFFDLGYSEGWNADNPMVQAELTKAAHYHALPTQVIEDRIATLNGAAVVSVQA